MTKRILSYGALFFICGVFYTSNVAAAEPGLDHAGSAVADDGATDANRQDDAKKKKSQTPSKKKFVDRNGDGINDGQEHRFKRRNRHSKKKRGTLKKKRSGGSERGRR